jgi:hypothetical protein
MSIFTLKLIFNQLLIKNLILTNLKKRYQYYLKKKINNKIETF